jgi:hypothetical protein
VTTTFTYRESLPGDVTDEALTKLSVGDDRLPVHAGRYRITGVTRVTPASLPGYTDVLISFTSINPTP